MDGAPGMESDGLKLEDTTMRYPEGSIINIDAVFTAGDYAPQS